MQKQIVLLEDINVGGEFNQNTLIATDIKMLQIVNSTSTTSSTSTSVSTSTSTTTSSTSPVKIISEDGLHVWHLLDQRYPVPKVRTYAPLRSVIIFFFIIIFMPPPYCNIFMPQNII